MACYLTFIEVSVDMGNSALLEVLKYLRGLEREEILRVLEQNALGTSDATYFTTIEEAGDGLLTGEAVFFVDGFAKAVKIPDDGYPNMGINEADSEKVVRGSNEGFGDSVKQNAALIRKRIRSPQVKVKEKKWACAPTPTSIWSIWKESSIPSWWQRLRSGWRDLRLTGYSTAESLNSCRRKMVFPVSTVSDDGTAGPGGNVHP